MSGRKALTPAQEALARIEALERSLSADPPPAPPRKPVTAAIEVHDAQAALDAAQARAHALEVARLSGGGFIDPAKDEDLQFEIMLMRAQAIRLQKLREADAQLHQAQAMMKQAAITRRNRSAAETASQRRAEADMLELPRLINLFATLGWAISATRAPQRGWRAIVQAYGSPAITRMSLESRQILMTAIPNPLPMPSASQQKLAALEKIVAERRIRQWGDFQAIDVIGAIKACL